MYTHTSTYICIMSYHVTPRKCCRQWPGTRIRTCCLVLSLFQAYSAVMLPACNQSILRSCLVFTANCSSFGADKLVY